jgi:phosphopantetheinyl transferase
MPVFFQHPVDAGTRLGIWKIEENEEFFKRNVPQHRDVTHPHKRLQHLAGRFLLQFLYADFPYELIEIADTRKPFLRNEQYHFSISHCGDYAAAIVSNNNRVGIDIELITPRIERLEHKFLSAREADIFGKRGNEGYAFPTLAWSAKEAVFKWYGDGEVDFRRHIQLRDLDTGRQVIDCLFTPNSSRLEIHYRRFDTLLLAWIVTRK